MHTWKNDKLKSQFELQKMIAKNNRSLSFTEEELAKVDLKSTIFTSIRDPQVRKLIELAYLRGTLHGLQLADEQQGDNPQPKNSTVIITKEVKVEVEKPVTEERLYFVTCKVKNKQGKNVYVNHMIKARTEADVKTMASSQCAIKEQTLIACKIVNSYGSDSMQFQFGIGSKEQESLAAIGRKYL
jgi:hypothetical protein